MNKYLRIVRDEMQSAPPLTIPELFADCNRLGLTFQRRGDSVQFAGDLALVSPELQMAKDHHEAELLRLLDVASPSSDGDSLGDATPENDAKIRAEDRPAGEGIGDSRNEVIDTVRRSGAVVSQDPTEVFVLGELLDESDEDQPWQTL